ncbi:MAG: hypothetical protein RIC16_16310 [Rhodospirillales bacterium]
MTAANFFRDGWCRFGPDDRLRAWVRAALPAARATVHDPAHAQWHRYQDTWFAGVNVLPNDTTGAVDHSGPLAGNAVHFIADALALPDIAWDKAQVSVCYPGYPMPMAGESEALHRFRRDRDAAHVDGLLREGPERRRYLREYHAFILGIPMVPFGPTASPFVVWNGSHDLVRAAFRTRFGNLPPKQWPREDVTEAYHAVRQRVFETCERIPLHAGPGEAFLVHRLAVHGMAPWENGADAGPDGRMIVYFRPPHGGPAEWLNTA